ncbi:hypothetical protein RND71_036650 [Anisodus tanguticus]|uniref:TF-B3 domain-containing protein n=1 Tax=Anisodus tanguticus TaxID=243964 RepID=A0AAE1UY34_9SOLA|nr:hypothetical protein RND71_036650 [Anisodus tanguticus]
MKVPPKKPHFFKPILPGFKHGLKIPIGFLKYLKGEDQYEHAILRSADKKWLVKVNGRRFEEGNWEEFVEQHNLQLGDILVFKHEGNMEFEVSIFNSNHCNREYAESLHEEETAKKFDLEDLRGNVSLQAKGKKKTDLDTDRVSTQDLRGNAFLQSEGKKTNLHARRVSTEGVRMETSDITAPTSAKANPPFVSTIYPYSISRCYFCLPIAFAKSNGLMDRREMILTDEKQRSWSVPIKPRGRRFAITRGLQQFMKAYGVQVGDTYKFELINNGTIPVAYFHCA